MIDPTQKDSPFRKARRLYLRLERHFFFALSRNQQIEVGMCVSNLGEGVNQNVKALVPTKLTDGKYVWTRMTIRLYRGKQRSINAIVDNTCFVAAFRRKGKRLSKQYVGASCYSICSTQYRAEQPSAEAALEGDR